MRRSVANLYRGPQSGEALVLDVSEADGDRIVTGTFTSPHGTRFEIRNGIPDFTFPLQLAQPDQRARDFYDARVDDYDRYLPLTFETFGESEDAVREDMVARLELRPDARVLEIGCGSGRDTVHIASKIPAGQLFAQDISPLMLARCRERTRDLAQVELSVANASYLPFADDSFDAVFQFGGVGEFSDVGRFFSEVARVARPGARVVIGDESMPPWLRKTDFAKILTFTNPVYDAPLPLEHLPIQARNVNLRWIIGGTFYLIDFTVGEGEPPADFEFAIPGPRGGTRLTRYFGQLEGVTPETKSLAYRARERRAVSMHDWLEGVVRAAAIAELGEERSEP